MATATLPAPGFWVDSREGRYSGFEGDLAHEIAEVLGLERVKVVQVSFDEIVDGELGEADVAISQLTPTSEREEVLDFSRPYLSAAPAVLARTGTDASDAQGLKGLRWVELDRSTLLDVIVDRVKPDEAPSPRTSRAEVLDAIRSDEADATMLDLPVALALARSEPDQFEVLGQLSGDEGLAAALPDGSENLDAIESALRQLRADGSIDELADRWFGGIGDDVPLIRVSE
ncbi:MAG: ABC transporter substrate-binding protein [Acidimicrobiales bacterium]|nr:ABC transporter substrate-binding protein [Acidimicrobiales bacterium]